MNILFIFRFSSLLLLLLLVCIYACWFWYSFVLCLVQIVRINSNSAIVLEWRGNYYSKNWWIHNTAYGFHIEQYQGPMVTQLAQIMFYWTIRWKFLANGETVSVHVPKSLFDLNASKKNVTGMYLCDFLPTFVMSATANICFFIHSSKNR